MSKSKTYTKELQKYLEEPQNNKSHNPPVTSFKTKPDPIILKLIPDPHPLTSEEQRYYLKITEGAFGFNEQVRNETLHTLSNDYNVNFLIPYLSVFIRDAIHVNLVYPDLSLLIYAIRMTKSLLSNPHVGNALKEQIHVLLPAVLSCVLSRKICKYNYDNHWTLRDFSAQVVATIVYNYGNKINDIKKRVIRVYLKSIQDVRKSFTSLYGGLKGLSSLGDETIRICVIPMIPLMSRRICAVLERTVYVSDGSEVKQVKQVTDLILAIAAPTLLKYKNINDGGVSYVKEFGYLGYSLYTQVKYLDKIDNDKRLIMINPTQNLLNNMYFMS